MLDFEEQDSPQIKKSISKKLGEVAIDATVSYENKELNYDVNVGTKHEFENGVDVQAGVHSDKNEHSVTVGVRKTLINPDNINNIENQDKVRKEELVETGERFNLQTKVGYSYDRGGAYTESSLMYRINDSNFLNTEYNQSRNSSEISATADLKNVKFEYRNNETQEDGTRIQTNTFNVMTKGPKNQYTMGVNATDTEVGGENPETNHSLAFDAGAKLNRTEYGEFNSGLNGEFKTALSLTNGRVSGYNASLDGAWNYYGSDHCETTDYLARTQLSFGKENDVKTFDASAYGVYRINNCDTIFESAIKYNTSSSP